MTDILSPQGQWKWDEAQQDWVPNQSAGGQPASIDQDAFKKAAIQDLLTTGGKNLSKIQDASEFLGGGSDKETKKQAVALRKEFSQETKNLGFEIIRDSWLKVQNAGDTGAGDLTIVYSYIKALDPNSVVREGEINLTKAAESIPSNIIRAYKRAKEGKALSPEVRGEMISEVASLYNEKAKQQKELNAFYTGLAVDSGADPQDVIGKIGDVPLAEVPEVTQKGKQGGATAGGVIGGLLGLGGGAIVGGPVGAGVGAGIGAAAGGATQNLIMDLLGRQTQTPEQKLKQVGGQALTTGALAYGGAKILPSLLRIGGRAIGAGGATKVAEKVSSGGAKKAVLEVGKKIESLNPAKYMREQQIKSAEKLSSIKINPKEIAESVRPLIKKIPSLQKTYDEYKGVVSSTKSPKAALEALDIFKDAYTQAGKVKSGLESKLLKTLYEATLKKLPQEVAENRTLTKYAIDVPKAAGKALWRATLGKFLLGT